ncbi:response regulator [Tahibacter amnicola]|uniref:histidine kinase n=1 Tax=Tahibacter amnicola TaxID=2976241 RepID=A0ABY6BPP6_9GAMM|nr:chemotaxis protein CheB [Tahibacter amnicola]UXI70526.1 response regulator [Tahibacter amnicola]
MYGTESGQANTDSGDPALQRGGAFDLVVLCGSAGGLTAVVTVLQDLPPDFTTPVLVMLHLPPEVGLAALSRRQWRPVEWLQAGAALERGKILVCPPRLSAEILPDSTCVLYPCEGGALERPIDRLLLSVARSVGDRALAVVLTGMGDDAAVGTSELHRAGACVLAQEPESAEYPSMPKATIAAGAATMVLPLDELGHVIGELADGMPTRRLRAELGAVERTFGAHGEVAARAREIDWSQTGLGAVISWPHELRVMTRMVVESVYPAAVWWGPDLIQIYNDPWRQFLGPHQHPHALGASARQTWASIWSDIGPMIEQVRVNGRSVGRRDYPLLVEREESSDRIFATFSYAPIRDAGGAVVGVYNTVWDTTRDVVADRRLKVLRELALRMNGAVQVRVACERAVEALASSPQEAPFALLYVVDTARQQAVLAGVTGLEPGGQAAPRVVSLAGDASPWPLGRALVATDEAELRFDNLAQRCPGLLPLAAVHGGSPAPTSALLLPVRTAGSTAAAAMLVLGLNPHLPFTDTYRSFVDLIVEQIAAGIAQARLHEQERERVDRLAELDRAKSQFFANVSHEFRTPLTLLLAPLDELLRRRDRLPPGLGDEVDTAARNARRLLTLVTNLLDFSQIESTRRRAYLAPHDLAALTADIVSHFRSAVERAGLRLTVALAGNLPLVPVDPEMWTKVVSNLLSNALKFTFAGEISIALTALRLHAELVVSDTGVGIPEEELPHVFKRFHRVRGARARTAEGAGIGLSIVQDLIHRMGGQLQVRSRLDKGTSFTIWLPYKSFRQTGEAPEELAVAPPIAAAALADEASRWLPDESVEPAEVQADLLGPPANPRSGQIGRARIVVVDDNADMRDYLRRLLAPRCDVQVAAGAESALALIRSHRPDVVLADVMMPGSDGFALLKTIRGNPALRFLPVVLVTARAGEETAIEGLLAGADDYIAKPFSPRELVARVNAVVDRARADVALRKSEARYRSLFESIDEGFCTIEMLYDEDGRAVDYRFLEANAAFERQTGLRNPVGQRMRTLAPGQEQHWFDIYNHVAVTGEPLRFEHRAEALDRWFSVYAFRTGEPEQRQVAVLFDDVTERKLANEKLSASQRQQAFLLKLSDALRPLADPVSVQAEACRVLGEHLAVDRAYYAEIDESRGEVCVRRDYLRGDSPSVAGTYRLVDYGWSLPIIREGRTIVFADVMQAAMVPDADRPALIKIDIVAHVAVPIVKEGVLVGCFCVSEPAPREWRDEEVELIRETGERTWAAVDLANAQSALRASEDQLRRAISVPRVGVLFFRLDGSIHDANEAFQRMCGYTVAELRTTAHWDVLTAPEFMDATIERASELAQRGETAPYEKQMIRKDGSRWWGLFAPTRLSGSGTESECVEFVFDVTTAKDAQHRLGESERRLKALVTSSWDIVYCVNADWTCAELLHGTLDGVTDPSTSWLENVVPEADRAGIRALVEQAVRQGDVFEFPHGAHVADGQLLNAVTRAVPVRDEQGEVVEWLVTTRI